MSTLFTWSKPKGFTLSVKQESFYSMRATRREKRACCTRKVSLKFRFESAFTAVYDMILSNELAPGASLSVYRFMFGRRMKIGAQCGFAARRLCTCRLLSHAPTHKCVSSSVLVKWLYQAAFFSVACLTLTHPVAAQNAAIAGVTAQETVLRAQLAKDPGSVPVLTALAELLSGSGHPRPAAELWRRAVALRPHDAGLQQALARALMDTERNREAIPILQTLTAEHPDLESAQLSLGLALARDERFTEAIEPLETALRLHPEEDAAELSLAKVLITLLRYTEAAPHVSKYATQHPNSFDAHFLLGLIASNTDQPPVATRELAAAAALDPNNYEVQLNLGKVLAAGNQPALAIGHLETAVGLRPSAPEPHYELSRVYRKLGDKLRSATELKQMEVCRQQKAVDRQVTVLGSQGDAAFAKAAYTEASQAYLAALALDPGNTRLHGNLALTYDHLGREREEQTELDTAARLDPRDPSIKSLLGVLAARAGEADRARTLFMQALVLDPDNAAALCGIGVLEAQVGHLAEAETFLQRSVESDPTYGEGYRDLGLVLAAEKRYPEAEAALHRSLEGNGNEPVAWTALGRLAIARGDLSGAVDAFRSAVVSAPVCSPERIELAKALAQDSEYDAALTALGHVGDSCPSAVAAQAHAERSHVFCALKRFTEAHDEWRSFERLNPSKASSGDFYCR